MVATRASVKPGGAKKVGDALRTGRKTYGLNLLQTLLLIPRSFWIQGFLTRGECLALYHWARRVPATGHILEVGSWKGKSAYCLAKGCRHDVEITMVDPLDGRGETCSQKTYQRQMQGSLEQQLEKNLRTVRKSRTIHLIRGTTEQLTSSLKPIHLLFLDGDHSEDAVRKDLKNLLPFFASKALLLFHDCAPWSVSPGPRRVVKEWVEKKWIQPVDQIDSIFVGRFLGF